MASNNNVLVVTDFSGRLHITPIGNKSYYQANNLRNKTQQYGMQEMSENEASDFVKKNNGIDPKFKTPKQAAAALDDKDAELNELRAKLKEKDAEEQKLRDLLEKASTGATAPGHAAAVTNADTTGSKKK